MRRTAAACLLLVTLAGCANAPTNPPPAPAPSTAQAPPRIPSAQEVAEDTYYSWVVAKNLAPRDTDKERELRRAHAVCSMFDDGYSLDIIVGGLKSNGYNDSTAPKLVSAAVDAFCPEHAGKVSKVNS